MVSQQRATAEERFDVVPPVVASAATRYQYARARIHEAREARGLFRGQVRTFVLTLRSAGEPLPAVLRHTRSMIQLLERVNAITPDDGWLEAEVLEWAIEEFEDRS